MIGNHEMEIDLQTVAASEPEICNLTETTTVTPVKNVKKRKIADLQAATTGEDEVMDMGPKNATKPALNSNNASGSSIKADMKRFLQSPDSELSKYYQIKSNNKLVLVQGHCGEAPYRNHPDTIKELNQYFEECRQLEESVDFVQFLKEKYPGLIAKLAQDSQVPQSELLASLRTILFPVASGLKEFAIDAKLLDGIVEKVSYGHPEASGNNFSAWSCTFWQVKDLDLLGESIGKHYITNFVIRNAAKMILENCIVKMENVQDANVNAPVPEKTTTDPSTSNTINLVDEDLKLMKIESGTATPKKSKKSSSSSAAAAVSVATPNANNSAAVVTPQVKISSFFAKMKKPEGVEKASGEYFQPFFVKPDVTLAPINQLRTLKLESGLGDGDVLPETTEEYWKLFKKNAVRVRNGGRQTCLCVGYDGQSVRAVLKLLKFEENYRPAYLGTWRKTSSAITPRRPFGKITEIDYEYDSDAEWDEGEDPEGESLSDLDDEDDDEEADDLEDEEGGDVSCAESVDSWLVPHGYLSDDEGVDEVHPGELEEAAREAELMPPGPKQKGAKDQQQQRKKFIAKEPVLYGPFHSQDQVIPQCLQSSAVQFLGGGACLDAPFSNLEAVFGALESSSTKKSTTSEERASNFPEALLPSLIQIVNANLTAGITKLYDEFILQHGKAVSRRAFESKLNQITTGKGKSEGSGGKMRWIFKEGYESANVAENILFPVENTSSTNSSTNVMQID